MKRIVLFITLAAYVIFETLYRGWQLRRGKRPGYLRITANSIRSR